PFPERGQETCVPGRSRDALRGPGAPGRRLLALRRGAGRAHRSQAHWVVHARPAWRRGVPPRGGADPVGARAARSRGALLRWIGRVSRNTELADAVKRSLERYFRDMDGEQPTAIYDMVLKNIE